ncbi:hypothetical protein SDC9_179623 [bioreactor metagenome]|uniref:Uncharacterized protein n=1 Tax=bioreactor metagenome TaxID=1076179 RepID=A0A645GZE7_9ZZZZ
MPETAVKFVRNGIARTTGSVPFGVTTLNHKAINHPVKNQAIIESFIHQRNEVFSGNRRLIFKQFNLKRSLRSFKYGKTILFIGRFCLFGAVVR